MPTTILACHIVGPTDALPLLMASADGDRKSTVLLQGIACAGAKIKAAAGGSKPQLCLCCPKPLRDKLYSLTFCLIRQEDAEDKGLIVYAICSDCASQADLWGKVETALRCNVPDLRRIEIRHAPGHA